MGKIRSLGFRHPNGECQVGSWTSALGVDERVDWSKVSRLEIHVWKSSAYSWV